MKTEENEIKNYYLKEFSLFDGENNVTFNITASLYVLIF